MPGQSSAGPTPRVLGVLALTVLALHGALLLGVAAPLELRLPSPEHANKVQLRVVTPAPKARPEPRSVARPVARPAVRQEAAVATPTATQDIPLAMPLAESSAPTSEESVPPAVAAAEPPAAVVATEAASGSAPRLAATSVDGAPLPLISLGALPPSRVLSYQLTGMDKGLTYHASGELRWQHNDAAYALTLSVRAFLIGSRQWRSLGDIDATGLVPRRFSDSWRNERAAHFDRERQRVVFSSNSTPAPLQPGAQDQVSLYVQLAAAMAGDPERFVPGTRLQVQTATVRDALPWSLVLQGAEPISLDGQEVQVLRWVCQPRNQYEARVEFWVTQQQAWLPVRIRITQASGSYIDLLWRGTEPLPPLPVDADTTGRDKAS